MLTLTNPINQDKFFTRHQKRDLYRKHKKEAARLNRLLQKLNLPVSFDNNSITTSGPFCFLESFKKVIRLKEMFRKHLHVNRHHNCIYSTEELLDYLVDCLAISLFRFNHMDLLQIDPGYQKVKDTDRIPDESTIRYLLSQFRDENIGELRNVNQTILSLKANMEKPREVWLDFDDTVVTVFGNQENSGKGYNPRYHGRSSYKVKVGFVSETNELLNIGLYNGKNHTSYDFINFLQQSLSMLPRQLVARGVRIDKGFLDEDILKFLEGETLEYVCKSPIRGRLKKVISYLNEQKAWIKLDETYSVAEIEIPLTNWEKARRFVFIREAQKLGADTLFPDHIDYKYQAIVTNMTD